MNMEAQPSPSGISRITLGLTEKLVATGVSVVFGSLCVWLGVSVNSMLIQQQLTAQKLEGVDAQLRAINSQLADVPALKLEVAKQSVRIDQHDADIKELKQLRSMR